jgi:hypothetical protein
MRARSAVLLGVFLVLAAPTIAWAKTQPFTGRVVGTTFEATYDVSAAGRKVCVSARKVRDRSAGVGELRLKIVGFPSKVFTDPDPGNETCLSDRDFADAVRDTKSIEARVYDIQDRPIANGRLKQRNDNGRRDRHPHVK